MKARVIFLLAAVIAAAAVLFSLKSPGPLPLSDPQTVDPIDHSSSVPTSFTRFTERIRSSHLRPGTTEEEAAALRAAIEEALMSTNLESCDFALTNLLPMLVNQDPSAAMRLADSSSLGEKREELLQRIAKLLAMQDPTNALAWASRLTHVSDRETTLTEVCLQMAEADPEEAVRRRQSFLLEGQSYEALEDLAQRWAEKDLAAALDWIASLPRDARRDQVIGRVAYVQAQTDPAAAARLVVEGMTPGDPLTEAAVSVLYQWGRRDLAAATSWANTFPEGPLRTRALQELSTITR
jgi:hypothetical protein